PGTNGQGRVIPVDRDGFLCVDWSLTPVDPRLTKADLSGLLAQNIIRWKEDTNTQDNAWKDKLVVIGSTATGSNLADLGATPLDPQTSLMSTHWNVANSIIRDRFIQCAAFPAE